jgi:protease I
MATILMPLPQSDFDPTETGVPWRVLTGLGHTITFATPAGRLSAADPRMVSGQGLGPLSPLLKADRNGRSAYDAMIASAEFQAPLAWEVLPDHDFDALLLPGGHAKGIRPYLESPLLQAAVASYFAARKPVGAICHGVLVAARSRTRSGQSILHGRKTTALLRSQEIFAWNLTRLYLGDYYRTYPETTVEDEVIQSLARPEDFQRGPTPIRRDTAKRPDGFAVVDGNYVSARWPGDAHAFANALGHLLA